MKNSTNYAHTLNRMSNPPQSEKAHSSQVENDAGGYTFKVGDVTRLNRFLILGSEGSYYRPAHDMTRQSAEFLKGVFERLGKDAVDQVVEVSVSGRAPKNTPALFALAMASNTKNPDVRKYALSKLPDVARTGTHLFEWVTYVDAIRGWGSGLHRAIGNWYHGQSPDKLAYQVVKYASRRVEGSMPWTHRDLLRKIHLTPFNDLYNKIFKYVVKGADAFDSAEWQEFKQESSLAYIVGHELVKKASSVGQVVDLIEKYHLSRESIPTKYLNEPQVWQALLPKMGLTAMLRNLGKMTSIGVLGKMSMSDRMVVDALCDDNKLRKARMHPLVMLNALKVYGSGSGVRGNLSWQPVQMISSALEDGFYRSFKWVEPTNKRWSIGVDVSGSMSFHNVAGFDTMTAAEAAAALAMVTAKKEPMYQIMGFADQYRDLGITSRDDLRSALQKTRDRNFGSTDCALPMLDAIKKKQEFDVFMVLTDNQTWYGDVHPHKALEEYRRKSGINNAKLIVVSMVGDNFTIANPDDPFMLDVIGFDSSAPEIMSSFAMGEI